MGAKNSVDMNYLPLAWQHGVSMFITALAERIAEFIVIDPDHSMLFQEELGPRGRQEPGQNP